MEDELDIDFTEAQFSPLIAGSITLVFLLPS
jgi:hypothetical protein